MNKKRDCDCGTCNVCNGTEEKYICEDLSGTMLIDIVEPNSNSNIQNLIDMLEPNHIEEIIILNELREELGIIKVAAKNKPNNPKLWASCIAEAKRKFDVFPCVPTKSSYILTEFGWRMYNEISPGDKIISYNIRLDKLEYDLIKEIHIYGDAQTSEMYNGDSLISVCTKDHRWVIRNSEKITLSKTKKLNKKSFLVTHSKLTDRYNNEDLSYNNNMRKILIMNESERIDWLAKNSLISLDYFEIEQFEVCATLLGLDVIRDKDIYDNILLSTCKPKKIKTKDIQIKSPSFDDVWCPVTHNKTWIMKQGDSITITGNSAYANGYASKLYKKKGGTWKTIKKKK